ncbi:MAG TPA: molybdopterin-synthase adenylyltransferase MoeB [Anaerolineaceae bacterium]|nr:molybdopterin-synthase adenylyltransferase MoeB [Anaerolineaceae bacterium]
MPDLTREEILRYSRQLMIPGVGLEGQKKLKAASVLVVGMGGLGSPVALYLAAAGVSRLGLVDDDCVDMSNLQRQVIHSMASVGRSKAQSAAERIRGLNPDVQVEVYEERFTSENAERISAGYDILVDGTDNFPTRYLLNDLAVLTGKPYVYGSVYRFEGQVSVFDARTGPCYRCLFPEPPPPGIIPTCSEGGVFGVLPGTIGTLQVTEVIKLILGIGEGLAGRLLLYDALDATMQTVTLKKNPRCKVCGPEPEVTRMIDYEAFCGLTPQAPDPEHEISPRELAERLRSGRIQLVDVRDPVEQQISALPGALNAPWDRVELALADMDRDADLVLFCRSGDRSARAVKRLLRAGFKSVRSLRGGLNAWAEEVDPEMRKY